MSYKHYNIRNAVLQVVSLHSMIATINDELARAREDMSAARYQELEAKKLQEFRNARVDLDSAVRNLKRELLEDAEKHDAAMLLEHGKNPYIQLISSGAILTADDLTTVLNQNPGNPLLLRSIENYATNHKIKTPKFEKALLNAKAAQTPHISRKDAVDTLANYLTNYAPNESAFVNSDQQERSYKMFSMLNSQENNLFEKLDNSI